jgi:hypothetical protein
MITVDFNAMDWAIISGVAWKRHDKYANTRSNYGTTRTIEKAMFGVAGEYAVSKEFGLDWTGMDDDMAIDVEHLEVRTRASHGTRLCLHDREIERKNLTPGQKYVLCWWSDEQQNITIAGWAYAPEIIRFGETFDGRHYLPNDRLHDIETVLL